MNLPVMGRSSLARTLVERRFRTLTGGELREEGGKLRFDGHPSTFNEPYDLGFFREQVAPGAFAKTIRESDVAFLFNHDESSVMARSGAGDLMLEEDPTGLHAVASFDPTDPDAQRLAVKMRNGHVYQMSFGFRTIKDEWDDAQTPPLRTLSEVQLFDVSAVTFPANPATDAQLRSAFAVVGSYASSLGLDVGEILLRTAIPSHTTAISDGTWDGPAAVAAMPNDGAVLRYCHAWKDAEGDPDTKSSYKFPHHETEGGPAFMAACRNGMSRLPQANIPDGDRAGVERHLQHHMDAQMNALEVDEVLHFITELSEVRAESTEQVRQAIAALTRLLEPAEPGIKAGSAPSQTHSLSLELASRRVALNRHRHRLGQVA